MGDPLALAIDRLAARGARLGEVRSVEREVEWLKVRGGRVEQSTHTVDRGLGVRALTGGWGYAGGPAADAARLADRAVDLADAAAAGAYDTIDVGTNAPVTGEHRTPCEIDPFGVSLEDKLGVLLPATAAMGDLAVAEGTIVAMRIRTRLRTTEGTDVTQERVLTGASVEATAADGGRVQRRSYPKSMEGNLVARGFEHVLGEALVERAPEVGDEARRLLAAEKVPSGEWDVILDGAQLSLQIHESCGHPTEGDRVLGEEMSLAGNSFLQPHMRGSRYGSELVTLYADGRDEGAAGGFGWDDEGTPATRVDLVRRGEFVGWLSGRESAARLSTPQAAAMRADSWSSIPIVRMTNVSLEPGAGTLDELIASTERGLLLSRNRSWSIDQLRLNFQFGCEAAWEIRDGEIVGLFRDAVYTGSTPSFWGSCDAICGPEEWRHWGWAFCGKGDPVQLIHVSHGCAPARFRGVRIL